MRNMNTFTVIRLIFNTKQRAVRRWHIWSGSMARLHCHRWLEICEKRKKKREGDRGRREVKGCFWAGRESARNGRVGGDRGGEGCLSVDVVRY